MLINQFKCAQDLRVSIRFFFRAHWKFIGRITERINGNVLSLYESNQAVNTIKVITVSSCDNQPNTRFAAKLKYVFAHLIFMSLYEMQRFRSKLAALGIRRKIDEYIGMTFMN